MNKTDTKVINGAGPQIPNRHTSATSPLFTKIQPPMHVPAAVPPLKPLPDVNTPPGEVPGPPPLQATNAAHSGKKPS